jgi:DNA invertase Pin-like site-specific DNA recombinase
MDRLGGKVDDVRRLVRELTGRGVHVQFMKEQPTFIPEAPA